MLRTVLLVALNLSLPWLLYLCWRLIRLQLHQDFPRLFAQPWPWQRLLLAGVALLALSLVWLRWHELPTAPETWRQANPARNWQAN